MVHIESSGSASPSSQSSVEDATPTHYAMSDIIRCMRNSAYMLQIADNDRPNLNELNRKQAELLSSAADDLEARPQPIEANL